MRPDIETCTDIETLRREALRLERVNAALVENAKSMNETNQAICKKAKAANERVEALEAWYNDGWLKGVPGINATVLIEHELGVGHNYDVACYQGKDAAGDDKFMSSCGTVIFKQDVLRYRVI